MCHPVLLSVIQTSNAWEICLKDKLNNIEFHCPLILVQNDGHIQHQTMQEENVPKQNFGAEDFCCIGHAFLTLFRHQARTYRAYRC